MDVLQCRGQVAMVALASGSEVTHRVKRTLQFVFLHVHVSKPTTFLSLLRVFSYLHPSSAEYKERRKRETEGEQTCLLSLSQNISKLCSSRGAFTNLHRCQQTQMLQVVVTQEGLRLSRSLVPGSEPRGAGAPRFLTHQLLSPCRRI